MIVATRILKKLDKAATKKAGQLLAQAHDAGKAGNTDLASQLRVAGALYHSAAGCYEDGNVTKAEFLKLYAEEYIAGTRKVGQAD